MVPKYEESIVTGYRDDMSVVERALLTVIAGD
jgi:hypothetical protein